MRPLKGAIILGAAAAFAAPGLAADKPLWHQHAAPEARLTLNQGRKWPTDVPLRQGMENIRAALAGSTDDAALARDVRAEVADMVQNCRLEPAADAQLHVVLVQFMAGAEAMEGAVEDETPQAGRRRISNALNVYGRHFDHPGWSDL
jgi:hypothetical protein